MEEHYLVKNDDGRYWGYDDDYGLPGFTDLKSRHGTLGGVYLFNTLEEAQLVTGLFGGRVFKVLIQELDNGTVCS